MYLDGKHAVFKMPEKEREERKRMHRRTDFLKKWEMSDEEFHKLLDNQVA